MPFPSVTLLDSLKRPHEVPLSNGGKWELLPVSGSTKQGEITTSEAFCSKIGSEATDYWTPQEFTEPGVAAEIFAFPKGFNEEPMNLLACLSEVGSNYDGYRLEVTAVASPEWRLYRVVTGVNTEIASKTQA